MHVNKQLVKRPSNKMLPYLVILFIMWAQKTWAIVHKTYMLLLWFFQDVYS